MGCIQIVPLVYYSINYCSIFLTFLFLRFPFTYGLSALILASASWLLSFYILDLVDVTLCFTSEIKAARTKQESLNMIPSKVFPLSNPFRTPPFSKQRPPICHDDFVEYFIVMKYGKSLGTNGIKKKLEVF